MKKKERHARAQEIIDNYSIGEEFTQKHLEEFEQFSGVSFDWIKRVPNKPNQAPARHLHCSCPEWKIRGGPFSWQQAVQRLTEDEYKKNVTNKAMRESLQFYQKDWLSRQEKVCSFCGSTEHPQADHKDVSFLAIQKSFTEQVGEPEVYYDEELGWKLKNEQSWIKYHNDIVTYQVLCRSCNASKGAR